MQSGYTIQNSTLNDIDEIFRLYRLATNFQKSKKIKEHWPEFDRNMVKEEIQSLRQFKILVNDQIASIWAITFNDFEIWGEKDKSPSMYIHRIATNPDFRGQNLISKIIEWAKEYAISKNREFLRLDTCGNNSRLIELYTSCGFEFLGLTKLKNTATLPSHYHDADICLFEIAL